MVFKVILPILQWSLDRTRMRNECLGILMYRISPYHNVSYIYTIIYISPLQTINSFPGTDTDNTNRRLLSPVQWCAHIFDLGAQAGHRVGISKALISARQAFTPCAHLLPVLFLTYSYVRLKAVWCKLCFLLLLMLLKAETVISIMTLRCKTHWEHGLSHFFKSAICPAASTLS